MLYATAPRWGMVANELVMTRRWKGAGRLSPSHHQRRLPAPRGREVTWELARGRRGGRSRRDALVLEHAEERVDHERIPLRAAEAEQLLERLAARERATVRPVARHRVPRVGDSDDRRLPGEVGTADPTRVARRVVALVMEPHELRALPELRQPLEELVAGVAVLAHLRHLDVAQRSGLLEDAVLGRDLADVVQSRRLAHELDLRRPHAHPPRELLGVLRDAQRVAEGVGVARVDEVGEVHDRLARRRAQLQRLAEG